ncbi:hypothetical protein R6Q57_026772 [Mikania cordata]
MAPPHNHLIHLSPSLPLSLSTQHHRRRCSKAQTYFFQILHIISVFPTHDVTDDNCLTQDNEISQNKDFVLDLNFRLRPPTVTEFPATAYGDENCVLEKYDRRKSEAFVTDESELAVEEARATEHSEISHVGDQSSGIDYNGVSELVIEEEKPRDEGYLGLLIEAAQLILGDDKQPASSKKEYVDAPVTARGGAKRKQRQCWTPAAEAEWYAEFEDTSPVVKSKRGRNQVLPFRYRDSVVEPLVRLTPATSVPLRRRSK